MDSGDSNRTLQPNTNETPSYLCYDPSNQLKLLDNLITESYSRHSIQGSDESENNHPEHQQITPTKPSYQGPQQELQKPMVEVRDMGYPQQNLEMGPRIVKLEKKLLIPVDKFPNYNFIGRILGPRGMTVRQMEVETGCRIHIRGKGSVRGGGAEEVPLHIYVESEGEAGIAQLQLDAATQLLHPLLNPVDNGNRDSGRECLDEHKRRQLMALAIINGTYRPGPGPASKKKDNTPISSAHKL